MPQQGQIDAQLLSQAVMEAGQSISKALQQRVALQLEQKKLDLGSLQKIKDFMSLAPEKRQALLQDPNFRMTIVQALDPESFATPGKAKKTGQNKQGMQQRDTAAMSLGAKTPDEQIASEKALAEQQTKQAEAQLAEQEVRLSTGVEAPTPMSLMAAGKVKDPIAAALFSLIPKEQLRDIALNEKKMGPLHQQDLMREWYKWGTDQGFPAGVAMTTALAVARGEWDKVPMTYRDANGQEIPVRGKAEQQLAFDATNTLNRSKEVQNTIESSIATSAAQLAEKAGLPLDQARANVMALRGGKQIPFPTPMLEQHAFLDNLIQQQEVQKNTQTILNDKSGITAIRESLNTMLAQYKEATTAGFGVGAEATDLHDKIVKLQQELANRLGQRYGINLPTYEDNHTVWSKAIGNTMSSVWDGMKTSGAFSADMVKELDKAFESVVPIGRAPKPTPGFIPGGTIGPPRTPGAKRGVFTPEQDKVFRSLHEAVQQQLSDPNITSEQRAKLQNFVDQKLNVIYNDPSRFNELLLPAGIAAPKEEETGNLPDNIGDAATRPEPR